MCLMRVTGMPVSDAVMPDLDYTDALDAFIAAHVPTRGKAGILQAYDTVRQMPYYSGPDRTPLAALRAGRGACTAKHIILRDLLHRIGARAEVEIVEGDFAAAIPLHPTQPGDLQQMIRQAGVTDFHCRVRLLGLDNALALDATWPDTLDAYGFAVNREWTGRGDTVQAMAKVTVRSRDDDVLGTKAILLAGLDAQATQKRLTFLRLLSGWLEAIDKTQRRL